MSLAGYAPKKIRDGEQDYQKIVETFGGNANVSEISLTLGFNAKGAFLGIGVGGAASVSVKIRVNEERQGR